MAKLGGLGRAACFLLACGLLIATTTQVRQFASSGSVAASVLLALPAGVIGLLAAYLIEASLLGWSQSSLRALGSGSASVHMDIVGAVMALLPFRLPAYLLSFGLLYVFDRYHAQPGYSLTHLLPNWGAQAAVLLLVTSFVSYWIHRLEHSIPALWSLHKFHHAADRMALVTAVRESELSRGVESLILGVFLVFITEPTAQKPSVGSALFAVLIVHFVYRTFLRVNQYLVHSNLTSDYGWVGRWLLVSPRMHRLHHSNDPRYFNTNFTFDLVIWDRLFGTYARADEATVRAMPLGLHDNPFNHGRSPTGVLRDYFLTTILVFWRELRRGAKAWLPTRR